MSATNLDLPVLISSDQIRRREFVTIRRGYDPDQVRAYLEQLAGQMEVMRSMVREARSMAETAVRAAAEPKADPYEQLAARVSNVIREADHAAEKIRTDALTEAEELTHQARAEADQVRTDAQARAEEARERADTAVRVAREEASRTIAGLATRRDALVEQLASMQERLLGVARDLESAMDLRVSLPEIDPLLGSTPSTPVDEAANGHAEDGPSPTEAAADDAIPDAGGEGVFVVGEADLEEDERSSVAPSYDELWEGTEAVKLEFPDIPPLDLDWGELGDERDEDHQD